MSINTPTVHESHSENIDGEGNVGESETERATIKKRREPFEVVRDQGKSLLPFAKVQKIIKADKELPIIAKEATFLISLATEEFIKRLMEAGHQVAQREKRSTVQQKDIATAVRRAEEFLFLEDILSLISTTDPPVKRIKPKGGELRASGPTLLDQFVGSNKRDVGDDDIIMNEDGTMEAPDNSDELNYT